MSNNHQLRICAWDYTAQRDDEVGAATGDIVSIVDSSDVDWYRVKVLTKSGKEWSSEGFFPSSYLKFITASDMVPQNLVACSSIRSVAHAYKASSPDELSIDVGDSVAVLRTHGDGWCHVRCLTKSGDGLVPENHLEIAPSAAAGARGAGDELAAHLHRRRQSIPLTKGDNYAGPPERSISQMTDNNNTGAHIQPVRPSRINASTSQNQVTELASQVRKQEAELNDLRTREMRLKRQLEAKTGVPSAAAAATFIGSSSSHREEESKLLCWLDTIGKGYSTRYGKSLIDEGYDSLAELIDANEEDLKDIGVKKAHAKKIINAIQVKAQEEHEAHHQSSIQNNAENGGRQEEEDPPKRPQRRLPSHNSTVENTTDVPSKPPAINSMASSSLVPLTPETPPTSDEEEDFLQTVVGNNVGKNVNATIPRPQRASFGTHEAGDKASPMQDDGVWTISPDARKQYETFFVNLAEQTGSYGKDALIMFESVYPFFRKSGLEDTKIGTILALADCRTRDSMLSLDEFCVAFHVAGVVARSNEGFDIPTVLPMCLQKELSRKETKVLFEGVDLDELFEKSVKVKASPSPETVSSAPQDKINSEADKFPGASQSLHASASITSAAAQPSLNQQKFQTTKAKNKSFSRKAHNFIDKKIIAGDNIDAQGDDDGLILAARAAGSIAGWLLVRKKDKKALSSTNWKKRRVLFSGARLRVYRASDNSEPSEELQLLPTSRISSFAKDKKDTAQHGFTITNLLEYPGPAHRSVFTARVGTKANADLWIGALEKAVAQVQEIRSKSTTSSTQVKGAAAQAGPSLYENIPSAVSSTTTTTGGLTRNSNSKTDDNSLAPSHARASILPPASTGNSGPKSAKRASLVDIGAHSDLRNIDSSCRLLNEILDSVTCAQDLKAEMLKEITAELRAAQLSLNQEIGAGTSSNERVASIEVILERMTLALQQYEFTSSAFGSISNTNVNAGASYKSRVSLMVSEISERARRRSIHES